MSSSVSLSTAAQAANAPAPASTTTATSTTAQSSVSGSTLSATNMTQSLSHATTLAINKTASATTLALTKTATHFKAWVDATESLLVTSKPSKTYASFLTKLVNLLFKQPHGAFVKRETAKFLQGIGKLSERSIIFPLDSASFCYLTDLKRITAYNTQIAQQNMMVTHAQKAEAVLIPTSTTVSASSTTLTPVPSSSEPNQPDQVSHKGIDQVPEESVLIQQDLTQSQTDLQNQQNRTEQAPQPSPQPLQLEPLLDLPTPPQFTFKPTSSSIPSTTSATLHPSGKGYGNLCSFFQHTVERQKDTIRTAPNLPLFKTNLQDLATALNMALDRINEVNALTQKAKGDREETRKDRVEKIREARVDIDAFFSEKHAVLESAHKERVAQLKQLQNAPIILPSKHELPSPIAGMVPGPFVSPQVAPTSSTSSFTQFGLSMVSDPFMLSPVVLNSGASSGRIAPMTASVSVTGSSGTRPGTANSQQLPDVAIGDFFTDDAAIEGMIADMLSD